MTRHELTKREVWALILAYCIGFWLLVAGIAVWWAS